MGKITPKKRVGFVATGSELLSGDILNTNGQYSAQALLANHIEPGTQITVGDNDQEIEDAIRYLLTDHQAIVTIGGLGPTSDDRTRYALAQATSQPLIFYEEAWQWVVDRITSLNLTIPENNRQQALLPQGATAIQNKNGTAAACYLHHQEHDFFMLPGPPNEYRSIFEEVVIPRLIQENYACPHYRHSWLLLGVSEGIIAAQLEELSLPSNVELGYRVFYPYLEIKINSDSLQALENTMVEFDTLLKAQSISQQRQTASEQLVQDLKQNPKIMFILDDATGGRLEACLLHPETIQHVFFFRSEFPRAILEKAKANHIPLVHIRGLQAYWNNSGSTKEKMPLRIELDDSTQLLTIEKSIPFRGRASLDYAVEVICWELKKLF